MFRCFRHILLFLLTFFLFAKELPFIYQWQSDTVYLLQWAEEGEKKSDQKEQEEKSSDDKKFLASMQFNLSGSLTAIALHILGNRRYIAPSGEITSPPPEVYHT